MGKGSVIVGTVLGLLGGVAGGFCLSNFFFKQKYEQKAEEEIASVRQAFANAKHIEKDPNRQTAQAQTPAAPETTPQQPSEQTLNQAAAAHNTYSGGEKPVDVSSTYLKTRMPKRPYMITVDDYRMLEDKGYTWRELEYYADGVLVDRSTGGVMAPDMVTKLVGNMWRDELGQNDDEAYVRNEELKVDVAISQKTVKYYA